MSFESFDRNGSKIVPASKLRRKGEDFIEVDRTDIEAALLGSLAVIDQEQLDNMSPEVLASFLELFELVVTFERDHADKIRLLDKHASYLGSLAVAVGNVLNRKPIANGYSVPHDAAMHNWIEAIARQIRSEGQRSAVELSEDPTGESSTIPNLPRRGDQIMVPWIDFPRSTRHDPTSEIDYLAAA